jgi:hypothetical protein
VCVFVCVCVCARVSMCVRVWGGGEEVCVQEELVATMAAACDARSAVYIGHEHRWQDVDNWFLEAIDACFTLTPIPRQRHPPQYRCVCAVCACAIGSVRVPCVCVCVRACVLARARERAHVIFCAFSVFSLEQQSSP